MNAVFILTINFFFKKEALTEAKEKAEIILDRNLSLHKYFTNEPKPVVYKSLSDSLSNDKYFEPVWMSSTYAIGRIGHYFKSRNNIAYYYKDAALNVRSQANEADSFELIYLKKVNKNTDIQAQEGIITIEGVKYYYLMKKGEIMLENCLVCHSTPENASQKLVEQYGNTKSFNRTDGEIISVVSIRIPLNNAFERASNNILLIGAITSIVVFFVIIIYIFIQKRLIFVPVEKLRKQASAISNDNSLLGQVIDVKSTKDLNEFVNYFNIMSLKLKKHQDNLDHTILERTASLAQSEQKYKLLAENISDVIWVFNVNQNKYTYISPSIEQLTGFTSEQALKQTIEEYLEFESAKRVKGKLEIAVNIFSLNADSSKLFYNEIQQICTDNNYIWVETISQLQQNARGKIEVLGVSRNIENRKKTEKKLKKYTEELNEFNKDKDKFFQILAHDLKQPFNSLLGFSGLLMKNVEKYDTQKIKDQLNIMHQTTKKTYNLLNDLLLWSSSHSGKIPFEVQKISVREAYNEIISNLESAAQAKNIRLAFHESAEI